MGRGLGQAARKADHRLGVSVIGTSMERSAGEPEYRQAFETMAQQSVEALGAELAEAAKKCEAMVAGVHSMVNKIKELAANYREEGKRYFMQIEECSLMTSEVRTVCEALKKKIATSTIAA